jgi:hypothetical protein
VQVAFFRGDGGHRARRVSVQGRMGWYVRRLARMSPPEIIHRSVEQARRIIDSRKSWRWDNFGGFGGAVSGLPGAIASRVEGLRTASESESARIAARDFELLNQRWPDTADWDSLWHLDPVTGRRWPGADTFAFHCDYRHGREKGDVKFVWEVNRLQFLPALAIAGRSDLVVEIVQSWMRANPPFQGINWTSAIEAASRVISLLAALAFLHAGARAVLDCSARQFLGAHIFWIRRYPSLFSSANNHRVAELVAQFVASICAPGLPDAAGMLAESRDGLEDRMQHLFHADGVGAEQSVTYAAYALEWFALAGVVADASAAPFSAAYKSRASRAADHLLWLMDDSGCAPAIGDGDETRVLALTQAPEQRYAASVAALVSRWLGAPDLTPPKTELQLRDIWGAMDTSANTVPRLGMRVFERGGTTVWRQPTPQGTLVLVFDHGPLGFESIAAHGHADALSVWLSWGDEHVFVDAGTYLYHSGGEWRDYFRATQVHNTLSIAGGNQSTIAGPFNWSAHAGARIVERTGHSITAEHGGYSRTFGVQHRRAVARDGVASFTVEDALVGEPSSPALAWSLGFLLAPGTEASVVNRTAIIVTPKGRTLRMTIEDGPPAFENRPCFASPSFGRKVEARRVALSGCFSGEARRVARLRIEPMIDH